MYKKISIKMIKISIKTIILCMLQVYVIYIILCSLCFSNYPRIFFNYPTSASRVCLLIFCHLLSLSLILLIAPHFHRICDLFSVTWKLVFLAFINSVCLVSIYYRVIFYSFWLFTILLLLKHTMLFIKIISKNVLKIKLFINIHFK